MADTAANKKINNQAETEALFAEYAKNRSEDVRNKIVERHLYLAEILSKKYTGRGIDYDDLYQVAAMALVFAVERFDSSKGFAFSSFATPTIIGEIKRYFRDKSWAVKVPRRIKELSLQLNNAKEKLQAENGRPPTVPQLADFMGCSEEEVLEALEIGQTYRAYSLDQELSGGDSDSEGGASLENYISVEESGYASFENADLIKSVVAELSDKERNVLEERIFGTKTQQDLAAEFGVSQMTISRLEASIREKFRKEYYKTD
jgi:RNA polymerase sigma-B factor